MNNKDAIAIRIQEQKVLPLFYHNDPAVCVAICKALYGAGIRCVEFTNRGGAALKNFQVLVQERTLAMPELLLGVGTIKSGEEATAFIETGADFLVSPVFDKEVLNAAQKHNCLWIPGCMTPTEIYVAEKAECVLIKLFPGNSLQPDFLEAIRPLFPGVSFMVTGGVEATADGIAAWLNSGAAAVGLGSRLITKELIDSGNYDGLLTATKALLKRIGEPG